MALRLRFFGRAPMICLVLLVDLAEVLQPDVVDLLCCLRQRAPRPNGSGITGRAARVRGDRDRVGEPAAEQGNGIGARVGFVEPLTCILRPQCREVGGLHVTTVSMQGRMTRMTDGVEVHHGLEGVVAFESEIAERTLPLEELREALVKGHQRQVELMAGRHGQIGPPLLAVAVIAIAFSAWLLRNRSRRAG